MRQMNDNQLRTLLEGMSIEDLRTLSAGIAALSRHAARLDRARGAADDAQIPAASTPRTTATPATERTPA
jgi:hypothetical protein